MSIKYGIGLVPEAAFTARVYQARQIICGQYACWAAEMFPLHLPLSGFFQCPEDAVASVSAGLGRVAQEARRLGRSTLMPQVAALPGARGAIALDFVDPNPPRRQRPIRDLHQAVMQMLGEVYGVVPNLRDTGESFHPHIPLMQEARLPSEVFEGAVEFAKGVVQECLREESQLRTWSGGGQLILMRLESNAADSAADGWDQGRWAADLRWSLLASYQI